MKVSLMPTSGRAHYRSYLLRIWQEPDGGGWRGSLRSVQDDRTFHFASLEMLAMFLVRWVDPMPEEKMGDTQERPPLRS
jgi:hypothetical protein